MLNICLHDDFGDRHDLLLTRMKTDDPGVDSDDDDDDFNVDMMTTLVTT